MEQAGRKSSHNMWGWKTEGAYQLYKFSRWAFYLQSIFAVGWMPPAALNFDNFDSERQHTQIMSGLMPSIQNILLGKNCIGEYTQNSLAEHNSYLLLYQVTICYVF